ncbi:hypothetical protein T310_3754 [Rasamsonia emersonii CBS 393.64]|uniref:Uncharacterized protein n=1 Tax=Rasamsonia emersonii (strain ATCC 16479 / CBS 393.64 / IMI 116815) TaxID=1408163 RepID=A0A0F4YVS8_RASE3|nr:hypothetical protein T310_3754 [Rasamsonia emersonii CBS 393.64]KKA22190.1 hypothetical protein T310_3754 [Rasamsonia emersonii CBS 393.64]
MMRLMNDLTDVEGWMSKVFDDAFVENWKKRVRAKEDDVSEPMLDWLVEELRFKAQIARYTDAINIHNGDVVKSDSVVLRDLAKDTKQAVKPLEKMEEYALGYNLGSDEGERDYVHPSFFPLVYGRSRILRDRTIGIDDAIAAIGQGDIIPVPKDPATTLSSRVAQQADIYVKPYSSNIQWLPFDVRFREDGGCYIASYINNVHPTKNRDVYHVIERVLEKIIPMWNMTLTPLKDMLHSRSRIEYRRAEYEKREQGTGPEYPQKLVRETQHELDDRIYDWRGGFYKVIQPEPGRFAPIAMPVQLAEGLPPEERNKHRIEAQMDLRHDYGDRGLQVILRIHNARLSPAHPEMVTKWHVEGQMNEHICASSLYFFDNENVEDPLVEFRQASDVEPLQDVIYDKGDSLWLEQVFGLKNNEPAVQEIGGITCREGRAVTWPNILQHRVTVRLKDRSKPGHCKAVNLMLVDPNIRIISTSNVPPQRLDWKDESEGLQELLADLSVDEQVHRLKRDENFPWTVQEAMEFMKKAREEREAFNHYQDVAFRSRTVSI